MPQRPDHWHVIMGVPGLPPDYNRPHSTKATAMAALRKEKAACRQVGLRFSAPSQADPTYQSAPQVGLALYVEPCWNAGCAPREEA